MELIQNKNTIVILAAGSSSRFGSPKQLLEFKESTLLKNTISEALKTPDTLVIVVTGANNTLIEKELSAKIAVNFNQNWESGMSSSIVNGLQKVLEINPDADYCIFSVCDQPFITNIIFENLINEHQKTGKGIIASQYASTLGTPVLFYKKYFKELQNLKGQEGAKKLIQKFPDDVAFISFEKGNIDIDTQEDYLNLIF